MKTTNPNIDPVRSHNGAKNKRSPWRRKTYRFYGKATKKRLGIAEFEQAELPVKGKGVA